MLTNEARAFVAQWSESLRDLGPVLTGENKTVSLAEIRERYSKMLAQNPAPSGITFEDVVMGGISGQLANPKVLRTDAVVVYIHGGAYIVGEPNGYHGISGNLAQMLGAR